MKIIIVKLLSLFRISEKITSNRILHWCTNAHVTTGFICMRFMVLISLVFCFDCLRTVSCTQCCPCLWMVHSGFPFWFPLTFYTLHSVWGIVIQSSIVSCFKDKDTVMYLYNVYALWLCYSDVLWSVRLSLEWQR